MTYYSVVRKSDGWELTSGCTEATDRVTTIIKGLKSRIDGYILDPREEDPEVDEARIEYHRGKFHGKKSCLPFMHAPNFGFFIPDSSSKIRAFL